MFTVVMEWGQGCLIKKSWLGARCPRPHLLLHAAEQGGVVTLFSHQLSVGAVLGNLPVLHQDDMVALWEVLKNKRTEKKKTA